MKKKTLIVAVIAVLCFATLATVAFFTAKGTATNVITTGSVELALEETGDGEQIAGGMKFDGIMPATEVTKIPTVKNVGLSDFYTRASVTILVNGKVDAAFGQNYIDVNIDGANWEYGDDGWYYYKGNDGIVEPGSSVTLFTTVSFLGEMPNQYQNCTVTIDIDAQAVQVDNNKAPGGDVTKIVGWPAE